jgi:hypothetical protein
VDYRDDGFMTEMQAAQEMMHHPRDHSVIRSEVKILSHDRCVIRSEVKILSHDR